MINLHAILISGSKLAVEEMQSLVKILLSYGLGRLALGFWKIMMMSPSMDDRRAAHVPGPHLAPPPRMTSPGRS